MEQRRTRTPPLLALRLLGAALLVAAGAIHLDLYVTGYRFIPTIGWMFLAQVVTAFVLAAALAVSGSWLIAAIGAGFAASTLAGYLLSVWIGLFGFKEVRTTAGLVAGAIEVAAVAILALFAVLAAERSLSPLAVRARRAVGPVPARVRSGALLVAVLSVSAAGVLVASAAVAAGSPHERRGGHTTFGATTVGGIATLTSASGYSLYWFALDTPTSSRCDASCTPYWPPVTGTPTAGAGVTGTLGTIGRSGGITQATYDGHPVYLYIGDSGPGQANGNGLVLNGGTWHLVRITSSH